MVEGRRNGDAAFGTKMRTKPILGDHFTFKLSGLLGRRKKHCVYALVVVSGEKRWVYAGKTGSTNSELFSFPLGRLGSHLKKRGNTRSAFYLKDKTGREDLLAVSHKADCHFFYFYCDSSTTAACYENNVLRWIEDQERNNKHWKSLNEAKSSQKNKKGCLVDKDILDGFLGQIRNAR